MSYVIETTEEVAQEIYHNGFYAKDWQEQYATWQEFMRSEDFENECDRLRSKFSGI
jgi:hypothetical protein